jgi:hypothetical protein
MSYIAVAFHFSWVGKDEDAAILLNNLDNDSKIRKYIDYLPGGCLKMML